MTTDNKKGLFKQDGSDEELRKNGKNTEKATDDELDPAELSDIRGGRLNLPNREK
ncbi:MAG: hypothetical protein K6G83_02795 [Lachnospiraceae bacterium]|nr:hypothetical protein [Lachnospiraceae bacterium]